MPENIENYEGLRRLYMGDFNSLHQKEESKGIVTLQLYTDRDGRRFTFKVKNLYAENEEIIEHSETTITIPAHVERRVIKAKGLELIKRNLGE